MLGVESFPTTTSGYHRLVSWLASHGELALVGVESNASNGLSVVRYRGCPRRVTAKKHRPPVSSEFDYYSETGGHTVAEELDLLADLHDHGKLTDEEFAEEM